jgi:hypothetical protein
MATRRPESAEAIPRLRVENSRALRLPWGGGGRGVDVHPRGVQLSSGAMDGGSWKVHE